MRLRVTFSKTGPLVYTSHLDLARAWERALRRAGAPLAYSQGFNPRPRLQLAAALPLGHSGEAEWLDLWLEQPLDAVALADALAPVLPAGLAVLDVQAVDASEPALQTRTVAAEYLVAVACDEPAAGVAQRVAEILAAGELPASRRGKPYDLRPLIHHLAVQSSVEGEVVLEMRLAAQANATGRPEAVLEALGLGGCPARFHRQRLLLEEA